jgi:hypothetical protein
MYEFWGSCLCFSKTQKNSFSYSRAFQKLLSWLQFTIYHLVCIYIYDETYFGTTFSFDDIHKDDEDRILFVEIIKPGLLPSYVFGKDQSTTYEFYNPSVCARHLGFGQLSIGLYFSDLIKPRVIIPSGTCYQCLLDRVADSSTIDLAS